MPVPDYQTLMLPILELAALGEQSIPSVEAPLAERFALSEEERDARLPSGQQKILHNRAHWAKFYLTKAGLIESHARGRFQITPAGGQFLKTRPAPLDKAFLLTIPAFQEWYNKSEPGTAPVNAYEAPLVEKTPEETVDDAYGAVRSGLRDELIDRILNNTPAFFEKLIVDLLVAMGYGGTHEKATEQLGKSGDGGVDGVINEDLLGLDRIYVQAKRYAMGTTISRPDIQAFTGSLVGFGATKGVFVTTSSFSAQAKDFAGRVPQRVILIDGRRLADLMIDYGVGVRTYRSLEFKRLDEDFFTEE
jgi:restriction system protein